jgi:hypothetical protein
VSWNPEKVTEFAISNTDIGCIGISVNYPTYFICGHMMKTKFIANIHKLGSRSLLEKKNTFLNT